MYRFFRFSWQLPYWVDVWHALLGFQYITSGRKTFISFFGIEVLPNKGWVTLRHFPGGCLLKPFVKPYEDCNDMFVRVRGWDDSSLVTAREQGGPIFPLSWTSYPRIIQWVDPCALSSLDHVVIQISKCFRILDTRTLITQDCEDDNVVEEYLCMHYVMKKYILI